MSEVNMFEQASRAKLRFDTTKGSISVEDLWDLPLTTTSNTAPSLDNLARGLYRLVQSDADISFVTPNTNKAGKTLQLKFEIVKYVIATKMAERDAAKVKADRIEKKKQILEILERKQNAALEQSSEDELRKLLAELGE